MCENLFVTYLKQRLDFCVEAPPLPISQLQIGSTIALQNTDGIELLSAFHIIPEKMNKSVSLKNYYKEKKSKNKNCGPRLFFTLTIERFNTV